MEFCSRFVFSLQLLRFGAVSGILLILLWSGAADAKARHPSRGHESGVSSHSCIHDQIIEQRKRPGRKVYSVTPQVYHEPPPPRSGHHKGRSLLSVSEEEEDVVKQPIRIYLNYDAVGHSFDRDCQTVGDVVKLGEPPSASTTFLACNPNLKPPVSGDCWYNCTFDDISGEDKRRRLRKALEQTADWFRRALAVEPVKGNLRLSGYSACGQDGGVQLPRQYVEEGIAHTDLVLLVTTRPTTGNTLAWAVACERDQWGRAIAGHVNVAPRHLTAESGTLLSATLIHEVMHVLGFDPHAFAHFRDERKRRRTEVTEQQMDEKLGRIVTRVVLPRVVIHSRHHYGAFSQNFSGLELEDGGGRGTSGSHWEKRLLMNEIMTGSVDTRSVVSKMTLALLEDSGWYKANYSMADRLDWGRNQGTQFVTSPCNMWKGAYHCNTTQLSGCTYNREAEGYCPILSYNGDLPQWARYFPQANKGGQSSLADYCTYFVAYSDGSCTDINSARAPDRMLGEVRGSESRCMASSLVRTGFVRGSMPQGNGCYQHRCKNNLLEVAVEGEWKLCPQAGGPIQFPGFNGELICPAYHELCGTPVVSVLGQCPNSCNFNGDCVDGKCRCLLGYHGHDCKIRSCPNNCSGHGKCTKKTQKNREMGLVTDEVRARAEKYTGDELCREKTKVFLKEVNMPNGLLPLKDIEEVGYDRETGVVWLKQKKSITHKFETIGKLVSYGTEVTAVVEVGKIKKLTGVKAKELLIWVTLNELVLEQPTSSGKINFRTPTGLSRTFPVSAFVVPEVENPAMVKNNATTEVKEAVAVSDA